MGAINRPTLIPRPPPQLPDNADPPPPLVGPQDGADDRVDSDADRPQDQETGKTFNHDGVGNLPNNIRRGRGVNLFNTAHAGESV